MNDISPAIQRVAVIGAGPLGRRLAALCANAGYVTVLEDVLPANLRAARAEAAEPSHPGSLHFATTVHDAVRDADLVLDSLPDELESKLEIFSMVDRMAPPRTILMTPASIQSIADLASCTYRSERCFSFEVPPGFLAGERSRGPLRVVQTYATLPEVREQVLTFWAAVGWPAKIQTDPANTPSPTIR